MLLLALTPVLFVQGLFVRAAAAFVPLLLISVLLHLVLRSRTAGSLDNLPFANFAKLHFAVKYPFLLIPSAIEVSIYLLNCYQVNFEPPAQAGYRLFHCSAVLPAGQFAEGAMI